MGLDYSNSPCWDAGVIAADGRRRLEGMWQRKQETETAKVDELHPKETGDPCGEYRRISIDVSKRFLKHIKDSAGWKEIKHGKQVTVLMKPSCDYPGQMYRVEATIEAPAEKLFKFLYLPEYRSKWDKALQQYKIVDIIDQDTFIVHSITHSYGLGLVSPRDFIFLTHIKNYEGKLLTTNSVSVDHPRFPPTSQYIRGTSFPCGYAVYPSAENPDHSNFLGICQVDLGGMLRPAVIDSAMPSTLLNLIMDCRTGLKSLKEGF